MQNKHTAMLAHHRRPNEPKQVCVSCSRIHRRLRRTLCVWRLRASCCCCMTTKFAEHSKP